MLIGTSVLFRQPWRASEKHRTNSPPSTRSVRLAAPRLRFPVTVRPDVTQPLVRADEDPVAHLAPVRKILGVGDAHFLLSRKRDVTARRAVQETLYDFGGGNLDVVFPRVRVVRAQPVQRRDLHTAPHFETVPVRRRCDLRFDPAATRTGSLSTCTASERTSSSPTSTNSSSCRTTPCPHRSTWPPGAKINNRGTPWTRSTGTRLWCNRRHWNEPDRSKLPTHVDGTYALFVIAPYPRLVVQLVEVF